MVLLLLERFSSLRRCDAPVRHRWITNLGLMLLGAILVSIVFPASVTQLSTELEGGLVSGLGLPPFLEIVLAFLIMDCWYYWLHRVLHEVPLLWRAHLVHHSDIAIDITTAERHHPLETILSAFLGYVLLFAMGFSLTALLFYSLCAKLSSLYTHANIRLPDAMDRLLRHLFVTPALHAIHHSSYKPETNSNYGMVLSIWDRLFGTYTCPALTGVPGFGLEYFRQPQDEILVSVLVQPFSYAQDLPYTPVQATSQTGTSTHREHLSPEWRQVLGYGGAGLLLVFIGLWPTVVDMANMWRDTDAYQYAWLVIPTFIYVACWHHRDSILAMTPRPGYFGLPLILLATVIWTGSFVADIKLGQQLAFVLLLQGIALCCLGMGAYRKLLPLMLLLFLMIPCGDILQPLLKALTVKWIEWFAIITGLPHAIDGYYAHIGPHEYIVLDACSGLGFFTLAGFLGYSFGLLLFRSLGKVVLFACLGAALGVLVNAMRVCLIVTIDQFKSTQMQLDGHADVQWVVLLAALGLLIYFASRLNREQWSTQDRKTRLAIAPQQAYPLAPVLAGLVVLSTVCLIHVLSLADGRNVAVNSMQHLSTLYPDSQWDTGTIDNEKVLVIHYDKHLDAVLVANEKDAGRIGDNILRSEYGKSWLHTHTERFKDCSNDGCTWFTHQISRHAETDELRHAFYAYYIGDLVTDSKLTFRLASGWNRLTAAADATGLIGFDLRGEIPAHLSLSAIFRQFKSDLVSGGQTAARPHPDGLYQTGLASAHATGIGN